MPYDVIVPYVMIIRERLKGIHFKNVCFQTLLKLNLCTLILCIIKPEVVETITIALNCLVRALLRNLIFFTHMFSCCLQRMASGSAVINIKFSAWHWHFDPMLNASVLIVRAAMRVYIFHGC